MNEIEKARVSVTNQIKLSPTPPHFICDQMGW
jgi:hypothetical protein